MGVWDGGPPAQYRSYMPNDSSPYPRSSGRPHPGVHTYTPKELEERERATVVGRYWRKEDNRSGTLEGEIAMGIRAQTALLMTIVETLQSIDRRLQRIDNE